MKKNLVSVKRFINGEIPLKKLISKGLVVGTNFSKQSGCFIDPTFPFLIEIGNNVTFSRNVTVLSHDSSTKRELGYSKIGLVHIGDNCFIGANATILPNVSIGNNVVVGAGCVVNRDIPSNSVAYGNPAIILCNTNEYMKNQKQKMKKSNMFDEKVYKDNNSAELRKIIKEKCKEGICYIK